MDKLYQFENLINFLNNKGIAVNKQQGYVVFRAEVGQKEFKSNLVTFKDDGIFFLDANNIEHRGYMYQDNYRIQEYSAFPKFHVLACKTIQEFKQKGTFGSYYRFSNLCAETIRDRDTGQVYEDKELELCNNCRTLLRERDLEVLKTSYDFFKEWGGLQEEIETNTEVDMFGYVKEWQRISRIYRQQQNYTCEKCNIILDGMNKRFLEVHHVNGDKTNNKEENLKCLCIECHSTVDQRHLLNYQSETSGNKIRLDLFLELRNKGMFEYMLMD